MTDFKRDMNRIQELVGNAFTATGSLVALADGGQMNPQKRQQVLEKTSAEFEKATLELRGLCEAYSPGVGGYGKRPEIPALGAAGATPIRSTWPLWSQWRMRATNAHRSKPRRRAAAQDPPIPPVLQPKSRRIFRFKAAKKAAQEPPVLRI